MRVQVNCRQDQAEEAVDVAEAWAFATAALHWWQRPFRRWLLCSPDGIDVKIANLDAGDDLQVKIQ